MSDDGAPVRPLIVHDFELDRFQVQANAALDAGRNVLVAAPTGSGKTVVGEHAVNDALRSGRKAFYTAPIKALSNQKHRELVEQLGEATVGLLTGDHSIRADAPVVVMTTEVLRNMIYGRSPVLDDLRWIVLDEVHFLQDAYRGPVWEEVLIHAPPHIGFACLSATVSNADELGAWIEALRGPTEVVVEHRRPVELDALYLVGDRSSDRDHLVPILVDGAANQAGPRFDAAGRDAPRRDAGRPRRRFVTPRRLEVIERLADEGLLPAINFIFSRAACDDAARQCLDAGLRLTGSDERIRIRTLAEAATRNLTDADLDVLGYDLWLEALERGIGSHHAGLVPAFREAVEACFAEGLVKVVFATETLALGVNMPARSVVIERLTRFNGEQHEFLTPASFTQLTGRAGRRGIDDHGAAIVLWSPFVTFDQVARLVASREYPLASAFRPTYNMSVNLVVRYERDEAVEVLGRSFAQFQADRSAVRLRRRADALRAELDDRADRGDVAEYVRLTDEARSRAGRRPSARQVVADSLAALRPGDVVERRGERGTRRLVVLAVANRRSGGVKVRACTTSGSMVNLHEHNVREPVEVLGHVDLPVPFVPQDPGFRRAAGTALRRANLRPVKRRSGPTRPDNGDVDDARRAVVDHPLHGVEDRDELVRAYRRNEQRRGELAGVERALRERGSGLIDRFDATLDVLRDLGHVDGWTLTSAGERLRRIYHERDLLISIAIDEGIFQDLDAASMAAVASWFTYEHRGADAPPPPEFPTPELRRRFGRLEALAAGLADDEAARHLPPSRPPDAGFAAMAHAWTGGLALAVVLDDEMTGGDFVRNARQLIDLLRQLSEVLPGEPERRAAAQAVDAMHRGVVDPVGEPQ